MRRFWKYQVRYRLARRLIHIGLFVMPPGRYKAELMERLWELYDEVCAIANLESPSEQNY
jgi:hypothetical protein